jgi:hypothetical protein
MKLAIKKPKGVFWKTDLSFEDIQKMLQAGKITEKWLVCPQGEAGDAVLISEFLAHPSIFKSNSNKKKEESKTKPKKKDLNVLLPCWALAYFPIVFLAGALFSIGDSFGGYYVFVFSGAALLLLIPAYAVIISILTVKRIKNRTNTIKITLFQLSPLMLFIFFLVSVLTFGGSPA